ncbi:MAG: PleD family two-component system response regulator [Chloroflexota bacterium]
MHSQEIRTRPIVLIAEDDRARAENMRLVLEADFAVDLANGRSDILTHVRNIRPDVLVMDTQIPRLDALAACRALRNDPSTAETPIIMVTDTPTVDVMSAAFDAGATDCLAWPFSSSQLRARASTCLMRRRAS